MRASAFKSDSGNWRFADVAQRSARQLSGHDGRSGLYQVLHGQRGRERHFARQFGDGASDSRVRPGNRDGRGLQAGRWYSYSETISRMDGADERGTGQFLDEGGVVPLWREWN